MICHRFLEAIGGLLEVLLQQGCRGMLWRSDNGQDPRQGREGHTDMPGSSPQACNVRDRFFHLLLDDVSQFLCSFAGHDVRELIHSKNEPHDLLSFRHWSREPGERVTKAARSRADEGACVLTKELIYFPIDFVRYQTVSMKDCARAIANLIDARALIGAPRQRQRAAASLVDAAVADRPALRRCRDRSEDAVEADQWPDACQTADELNPNKDPHGNSDSEDQVILVAGPLRAESLFVDQLLDCDDPFQHLANDIARSSSEAFGKLPSGCEAHVPTSFHRGSLLHQLYNILGKSVLQTLHGSVYLVFANVVDQRVNILRDMEAVPISQEGADGGTEPDRPTAQTPSKSPEIVRLPLLAKARGNEEVDSLLAAELLQVVVQGCH
mmetsp:Transcript_95393/g.208687  ORF Transcript_95393/g.208687 Transcript_95393/m.208687 type:complete len:383 (+) Transcript_95393:1541-2689(+)